jgi:hypothetical protein
MQLQNKFNFRFSEEKMIFLNEFILCVECFLFLKYLNKSKEKIMFLEIRFLFY